MALYTVPLDVHRVVSFDLGIRNFTICILDYVPSTEQLSVSHLVQKDFGVAKQRYEDIQEKLRSYLFAWHSSIITADVIIIERHTSNHFTGSKKVEMMFHSMVLLYRYLHKTVIVCNANHKGTDPEGLFNRGMARTHRKRASIQHAKDWLGDDKKIDDHEADAFNQGMYYLVQTKGFVVSHLIQ